MTYLVVLFALVARGACSRQQQIIIYDEENQKGNSYVISNMNTYTLKFVGDGWDKRIVSAKITGIYLFYDKEWFDAPDPNSGVSVAWGQDVSINLGHFSRKPSSLRQVGESYDWKSDAIVFFTKDVFRGQYIKLTWNVDDIIHYTFGTHFWSVIVTGSSPWTVYSKKDYKGDKVCFYPENSGSPGLFKNKIFLKGFAGRMLSTKKGCHVATRASSTQQIIIYDEENQKGNSYVIYNKDIHELKLVDDGWDKRIVSVKFTGIYLFYDKENFTASDSGVYVAWGQDVSINLGDFSRKASSLRHVGISDDWKYDTIVFFSKDVFRGQNLTIHSWSVNDLIHLSSGTLFWSVIVTGSSPFTVYSQKNYGGDALCLHPGYSGSPGLFKNQRFLKGMSGRMLSVKTGCHSTVNAYGEEYLTSFAQIRTLGPLGLIQKKLTQDELLFQHQTLFNPFSNNN